MKKTSLFLAVIGVLLAVLAACAAPAAEDPTNPAATTPVDIPPTVTEATATAAPASPATDTAPAPTEAPTAEPLPTARPTRTPAPTPTAGPSGFVPPGRPIEGFTDGLVMAAADGSLIVYYPGSGRVETLLGTNGYRLTEDTGLVPLTWPPRFSPDGRYLVVPRPAGDTWLVARGPAADAAPVGAGRPIHPQRLFFTWAPDSRRIAFTAGQVQFPNGGSNKVYAQDVVGGEEATLLAELPGMAYWPVWSPGCPAAGAAGDCGQSVAVMTSSDDEWAIMLVDAATGEARELGRFRPPPIGGTLWHRWTADGRGVIAQADRNAVFFPLDGAPRPLVVEQGAAPLGGYQAPVGDLFARAIFIDQSYWQLVIGDAATGETQVMPQHYDDVQVEGWTGDGRFALAGLREPREDGLRTGLGVVDTATWPGLPEPTWLEMDTLLIGIESAMLGQSTEVDPRPWAAVAPPAAAGPVATWTRQEWPAAYMTVGLPAGWRAQQAGRDFIVANYEVTGPGLVALSDEQFRAALSWNYYLTDGYTPDFSVEVMQSMYYNDDVRAFEAGDAAGVVLADRVTPVCETIILPHNAGGYNGELWINYCPATDQWRAFMIDFVAALEFGE